MFNIFPCLASAMPMMVISRSHDNSPKDPTTKLSSSHSVSNPWTRGPVAPLASQKANSTLFIWQSLEAKNCRAEYVPTKVMLHCGK